jgi:hypothetical protein
MPDYPDIPYISETIGILAAHLGLDTAVEVFQSCDRRLADLMEDPEYLARPVAQCSANTAEEELWTMLLGKLAARRPDLFGPELAELSDEPRGAALAWLFTRHSHPDQLRFGVADIGAANYKLAAFRSGLVTTTVASKVAELANVEAELLPPAETEFWRAAEGSLLDLYLRANGWSAICLFNEPTLRRQTFLYSDAMDTLTTNAPAESGSFQILVHEHLHSLLTEAAMPGQVVRLTPLKEAVNEAVVDTLSGYAIGSSAIGRSLAYSLSRPGYRQAVFALLSLVPDISDNDIPRLAKLGRDILRCEDDNTAARILNIFAEADATTQKWLAYFTGEETLLYVRLEDPDVIVDVTYEHGSFVRYYDWTAPEELPDNYTVEEHCLDRPCRLHCLTGPACIRVNGDEEYWVEGECHRDDDLPALIGADGYIQYHQHNELHRLGGPSIIHADGSEEWWVHDQQHRADGPAYTDADTGEQRWFLYGELHRSDGPPVVSDEKEEWWVHGRRHRGGNLPAVTEFANGNTEYWVNGMRHREDGPAVEAGNLREWYRHDVLYREDGPAMVLGAGCETELIQHGRKVHVKGPAKLWFGTGGLHRPIEEGPAVIEAAWTGKHQRPERRQYWGYGERVRAPRKPRKATSVAA